MANALYTKGKEKLLQGVFDLENDTIQVSLVDQGVYTPNLSTDDFRADIPNNAIIDTQTLANTSVTDGVFDADDVTYPTVPSSANTIEYVVLWKDTGDNGTSPLLALIDTASGLPTTPNDGDIILVWDNTTNKIFKLT